MIVFRYLIVASASVLLSAPACAQWATRTRLLTSPNPSASGQQVQLTAEVDGLGGGAPTGSVSFADGATSLGSAVLSPYGAGQAAIALGSAHSCALSKGAFVYCWGWNNYGQIGDGTTANRSGPVVPAGLSSGIIAVAAGIRHTCVITRVGAVDCWGDNWYGQLGDGTRSDRLTPVTASNLSSGVVAIATGHFHSCALTGAGAVKCWGSNEYGELGDGTTTNRYTPVPVNGLSNGVIAITAGFSYTCALTSAGAVKCWGNNSWGQLGDGTRTHRGAPVFVSGLSSGVVAIEAGATHMCALSAVGAVKCWGANNSGQVGDGTTMERWTPVAVSGLSSGVAAVTAGPGQSCAVTRSGAVKCWGGNDFGQVGDGTRTQRHVPVSVPGLSSGVVAVQAGTYHTCALTRAGVARCWGGNQDGELGDGTTTDRLTPTVIPGFISLVRARALLATSLSVGSHSLRASYPGDTVPHSPSSGVRQQIIY